MRIASTRQLCAWMLGSAATIVCAFVCLGTFESRMKVCRMSPAMVELNRIATQAKLYFERNGSFPRGQSTIELPRTCCPQACRAVPARAFSTDPIWAALDFVIDRSSPFQFWYDGDGRTFRAIAIGDRDCDGASVVYVLDGTSNDGVPATTITEPPPNAD
jgi:hypothetical protein